MASAVSQYRRVEPALLEQRQHRRHAVFVQRVTVRRSSRTAEEASLTEISIYGCRLSITGKFKAADKLSLQIANSDPIIATAVWYNGTHLGCLFDHPISKQLLRQLTLNGD